VAGTIVGVRQDAVDLQVVRPGRVARIGEVPAERAMAEARQAQDAGTAEARARAGPVMPGRVVRAAAARPPMDAEQQPDRDRAHARTGRAGTRPGAQERALTEGVASRHPGRRRGRTDHERQTIGPARAVRAGEVPASAATGRTETQPAPARTDPLETRVLSVETVVGRGALRLPTGTGAQADRRPDRRVRVTATGPRGRIVGRGRRIPGRPVRAMAIVRGARIVGQVPVIPVLLARGTATGRGARIVGQVPVIPARPVRGTATGRGARIEGRAPLIPVLLARAMASGLRDWCVGHARRILGCRVRDSAVVPRVPIVDHVQLIPAHRVRAIAVVPRGRIVAPEAAAVGRCVATRRRALSGSYVPLSSRDRRCLGRTAASASRCHLASVRVTTSRRPQRSIRKTYLEVCGLS
jgi:hypothetical protein